MKILTTLLTFTCIMGGCKNPSNGSGLPTSTFQSETSDKKEEEVTKRNPSLCFINEDSNPCQIAVDSFKKLEKLSANGYLVDSILDLEEVKASYQLSEDQVQCIKTNYCQE